MIPGLKTSDGALYCTTAAPAASDVRVGGVALTAEGWVHVNANAPQKFDQGKAFSNNGDLSVDLSGSPIARYMNGLPLTATGALKCQLNQPVSPGDAYVGGLRVGPLGGLYIVDAAPVWTPANLFASGEQGAWYDPSDFSTMFQDSAGTTPVTAVGQTVGKILDKSGRNNHATQATSASRPVLRQDANSKYYLEFDGVDDSLETAAINFTATNKMSVWVGVMKNSVSDGIISELSDNTGVGRPGSFYLLTTGANYVFKLGGNVTDNINTQTGYTAPVTNILTSRFDFAQTTAALENRPRINGSDVAATGGNDAGTGNFGNYVFYIGSRANVTARLNGRIYSLIVRGAISTTQEITDTETWVNSKTGAY